MTGQGDRRARSARSRIARGVGRSQPISVHDSAFVPTTVSRMTPTKISAWRLTPISRTT